MNLLLLLLLLSLLLSLLLHKSPTPRAAKAVAGCGSEPRLKGQSVTGGEERPD